MTGQGWSDVEDKILRRVARAGGTLRAGIAALAAAGHARSHQSTVQRARRLDLAFAPPPPPTAWRPDWDDVIRAGLRDGLSYGQIVPRLAVAGGVFSRSAVIGRARRIGLAGGADIAPRRTSARAPRVSGRAPSPARAAAPPVDAPDKPGHDGGKGAPPPPAGGVAFITAPADVCRWPVSGEGLSLRICGARAEAGRPYCPACRRLAYQPASRREPSVPWEAGTLRRRPRAADESDLVDAFGEAA